MKTVVVIDGQGGGIGSIIIKKLKEGYAERIEIIALGTNAVATANMLKAGANRGASGENAISNPDHYDDLIVAKDVWEKLAALAYKTYVPSSEQSRLSGAGAGLNDND